MEMEKKVIWICIGFQTIAAYVIVTFMAAHYSHQGLHPLDALYWYGIAFTCSNGIKMYIVVITFLSSFAFFHLSTTSAAAMLYLLLANILLAVSYGAPIFMILNGMIANCWND